MIRSRKRVLGWWCVRDPCAEQGYGLEGFQFDGLGNLTSKILQVWQPATYERRQSAERFPRSLTGRIPIMS